MEASDAVSWNFGPQAKIPTLFLSFCFVSGFVICVLVVSVVNRAPSLDCGEVRRKAQFLHALAFNPFSGSSTRGSLDKSGSSVLKQLGLQEDDEDDLEDPSDVNGSGPSQNRYLIMRMLET